MPSAFVVYLLVWLPVACVTTVPRSPAWFLQTAFLLALPAYAALVAVTTVSLNPFTWLMTAAGVFATHVTYGVQFLRGLCAGKAPCEFIGKDHA